MLERLLELTDRREARLAILFLLALALFLNRDLVAVSEASYEIEALPPPSDSTEPPKVLPAPSRSWRDWSSKPPPPLPSVEAGYRSLAARVRADLIRLGYRTPAFLAIAAEFADRRIWHEIRGEYEAALRAGDLRGALKSLEAALDRVSPDNPMLKRELLEHIIQLQLALSDVAGAETAFRQLMAAETTVAKAWTDELKANPELAKRLHLDPNAPVKVPTPEEISSGFSRLAERARAGKPLFKPTPEEWAALKERAGALAKQGKLDAATIRLLEGLGQGAAGGRR